MKKVFSSVCYKSTPPCFNHITKNTGFQANSYERSKRANEKIWFDEVNRLVYRVSKNTLEILSCRGHYED